MSAPRATSRSTSLVWSRRGWRGWRCSWWSRWPTWSSGDHCSSSPWSTGAGSGRTPRSRCLTRWRQSRTCNPPSSWFQGLSSCGLCPLLCQPTSLCCPPQGLQVNNIQSWKSSRTNTGAPPSISSAATSHSTRPGRLSLPHTKMPGGGDGDNDDAGYVDGAKAVIAL